MSTKQQAILVGGVVTALLSTSYLGLINIFCCLGVILGGIVAVQQYTSLKDTSVETGDGAVLGAGAGAIGSLLATLLDRLLRPLSLDGQSLMMGLFESFMDPQQMEMVRQQMEASQQSQSALGMLMTLLFGLAIFAVFGAIGGAIGASIFQKNDTA